MALEAQQEGQISRGTKDALAVTKGSGVRPGNSMVRRPTGCPGKAAVALNFRAACTKVASIGSDIRMGAAWGENATTHSRGHAHLSGGSRHEIAVVNLLSPAQT